jgi:hypothetical protein
MRPYTPLFVHMHHWPCQLHKHRSRIGSSLGFHVQLKVVLTVGPKDRPFLYPSYCWNFWYLYMGLALSDTFLSIGTLLVAHLSDWKDVTHRIHVWSTTCGYRLLASGACLPPLDSRLIIMQDIYIYMHLVESISWRASKTNRVNKNK